MDIRLPHPDSLKGVNFNFKIDSNPGNKPDAKTVPAKTYTADKQNYIVVSPNPPAADRALQMGRKVDTGSAPGPDADPGATRVDITITPDRSKHRERGTAAYDAAANQIQLTIEATRDDLRQQMQDLSDEAKAGAKDIVIEAFQAAYQIVDTVEQAIARIKAIKAAAEAKIAKIKKDVKEAPTNLWNKIKEKIGKAKQKAKEFFGTIKLSFLRAVRADELERFSDTFADMVEICKQEGVKLKPEQFGDLYKTIKKRQEKGTQRAKTIRTLVRIIAVGPGVNRLKLIV